jgi:hypothetical protein
VGRVESAALTAGATVEEGGQKVLTAIQVN